MAVPGIVFAQNYTISTLAGRGLPDGLPAAAAGVGFVSGVATDAAGNFYFAAQDYSAVYQRGGAGALTRVAGNGERGFSGDGGTATGAKLNNPRSLSFDSAGNLYIADLENDRIRKISNGVISTVAGGGFVLGDNGPATSAQLNNPMAVAVDSAGNLYIADSGNHRIRKVSNGTITTVAGNGTPGYSGDGGGATDAQLNRPNGVALDSAGNLYISDTENHRIRKVSNGTITTAAGSGTRGYSGDNGSPTSALLSSPIGITLDSAGNLYIADLGNYCIRKVSNGVITTAAGTGIRGTSGDSGPATSVQLSGPIDVALDAIGNLYIADGGGYRIRKVSNGLITTVGGNGSYGYSGDNGPATNAQVGFPSGVAGDSAGNLYIADTNDSRVRKVSNGIITTVAGNGTYGWSGDNGPATDARLKSPTGVAVDSAGSLYIADYWDHRIRKVSNGVITTVAGSGTFGYFGDNGPATSARLAKPNGLAVDSAGNLYIADTSNNRIRKVANGVITTVAGGGAELGDNGPAINAHLSGPSGVAVDSAGNLYIADAGNQRIRKVSDGVITTVAGNGTYGYGGDGGPAVSAQLSVPSDVAVDSAGNLFIVDRGNRRIRTVSNGKIWTIAGNGTDGFSGDGGPAMGGQFNELFAISVDSAGNLYIAERLNHRIRKLSPGGVSLFSTVSAASFAVAAAPGIIAAGYGSRIVPTTEAAPATGTLPTTLAQTSVRIKDSSGVERTAPLWFVSPNQINYYISEQTALGPATVTVVREGQTVAVGTLQIDRVAPGLFAMNANGQGVPAALVVISHSDGTQNWKYVFNAGCQVGSCQPVPIDLGPPTDQVFLQLYGTGIRGRSSVARVVAFVGNLLASVQYAGPVQGMVGLDQVNLRIPRSLIGRGEVSVLLSVDGSAPTNLVQVNIR